MIQGIKDIIRFYVVVILCMGVAMDDIVSNVKERK